MGSETITSFRCQGTTRAGHRCRRRLNQVNDYCNYHEHQRFSYPQPSSLNRTKAGYVYMYTLEPGRRNVEVWSHSRQKFEKFPVVHIRKNMWGSFLHLLKVTSAPRVLIKIGFTTTTPEQRIEAWRRHCGHRIELVVPPRGHSRGFDSAKRGWPVTDAHLAERHIHSTVGKLYGRGDVQCGGCDGGKHLEWFLVPRDSMGNVYDIISSIVS